MSKKNKSDGLISARDLPPLKVWAFPEVASTHVVRSPFKEQQSPESHPPAVAAKVLVSSGPLTVAEIEKLRAQARQQGLAQGLEEGRKKGLAQGLEAGRTEGYQAAYNQAEAEITDLKSRLSSILNAMQRPLDAQLDGLEQALLRMVVDTAEAVTKQELSLRPELLRQAVSEALDALPQQAQQLCFYVHPDDETLLKEISLQERASWEVVVDPAMSRGGIRVRGECSFLDYSVEKRFSQVAQQILTASAKGGSDDGAG